MTADLGAFLQQRLGLPRRAAEWDCCAFPAAWAIENGLPDPMAAWRGTYATDDEAQVILAREGGLLGIFGAGLEGAGMTRVDDAIMGDVGVIALLGHEAGGIYTGRRWAFVAERGLAFASLDPEAVSQIWRLPGHG